MQFERMLLEECLRHSILYYLIFYSSIMYYIIDIVFSGKFEIINGAKLGMRCPTESDLDLGSSITWVCKS